MQIDGLVGWNAANQEPPEFGMTAQTSPVPSWTLFVTGRVLSRGQQEIERSAPEDQCDPQDLGQGDNSSADFWELFQDVAFELPTDLYPRDGLVKWTCGSAGTPSAGFRLRREGSRECDIRLRLRARRRVGEEPRYTLSSPALSALLRFESGTIPALLRAFWAYVGGAGLVEERDALHVRLDEPLQRALGDAGSVGGEGRLALTGVLDRLRGFLVEAEPVVHVNYRLRLGGGSGGSGRSDSIVVEFDVPAPTADALRLRRFLSTDGSGTVGALSTQCAALESEMEERIDELEERRRKRAFFLGVADRPADALGRVVDALVLDLETMRSDGSGPHCALPAEEARRARVWQEPWVDEACLHYLWSQVVQLLSVHLLIASAIPLLWSGCRRVHHATRFSVREWRDAIASMGLAEPPEFMIGFCGMAGLRCAAALRRRADGRGCRRVRALDRHRRQYCR